MTKRLVKSCRNSMVGKSDKSVIGKLLQQTTLHQRKLLSLLLQQCDILKLLRYQILGAQFSVVRIQKRRRRKPLSLLERNEPCEIDAELIELIAFLPLRSFSHWCTLCTVFEKFSKKVSFVTFKFSRQKSKRQV